MRWKVCQDVRAAVKLYNELIEDSNSISSYAINIRKFQEYPSKHCASNDKCKALRRCHNTVKIFKAIQHRSPDSNVQEQWAFLLWKAPSVNNRFWKKKSLNNIIQVHNQLRKRYYPAASDNVMAYSDGLTYHVTNIHTNKQTLSNTHEIWSRTWTLESLNIPWSILE